MNGPVRRVALAVMAMVVLLMANLTYVQVVQAGELRSDTRNQRVLFAEYARDRGQISAGGKVLAESVEVADREFERRYPDGPVYAAVTGYFSATYGSTGIERFQNDVLNGSDDRLFVRRLSDLVTGRDPSGGNVVLTIDPAMQRAAYDQLNRQGFAGAVVALRPKTGEILAMVSTPSFDPAELAGVKDIGNQQQAWKRYNEADPPVLVNRAIQETYPPGSTFKVVNAAAALSTGFTPESQLTAASSITLAGTRTDLQNFAGTPCGTGRTASLRDALARSCNTAFAELAAQLGEATLRRQAEAFGIDPGTRIGVPMAVAPSTLGDIPDAAALQQSGIGQRDVRLTPMQNAMVAAAIANGGQMMKPYLVKEIQTPDLEVVDVTEPDRQGQAVDPAVARTLTDLMIGAENRTQGSKIPGVQLAAKTGTAEHGADPKTTPPHNWYIAFGPVEDPQIAVAVLVENGGDRNLEATGGSRAAPIGRAVIAAGLRGDS